MAVVQESTTKMRKCVTVAFYASTGRENAIVQATTYRNFWEPIYTAMPSIDRLSPLQQYMLEIEQTVFSSPKSSYPVKYFNDNEY